MTQILSSVQIRSKITKELRQECKHLINTGIHPFLKVILVGHNPASIIYTTNKKKYCEKVGAKCEIITLDENISEVDFLNTITSVNNDSNVHGCIIQLPLPKQLTHLDIGKLIIESKDIDGFHPNNIYALLSNSKDNKHFISCTPKGILTLLKEYKIEVAGKRIAVIGRSMIVGKPLACLLTNNDATVTLCHSKTSNLRIITRESDIIISAIGIANFIDESFISKNKNQIIIDVGMNTNHTGQLCGDVNFNSVLDHVHAISPVPGGVGPMTIVSLVQNLLQACTNKI